MPERARDRMRRAGQRRPRGVGPRRDRRHPPRGFYDYEAKYLDERGEPQIPAPLTPEHAERVRRLSVEAFRALDGRRHGARRLLPDDATTGELVRERGEHHPRLHHDQHVSEDVGGQRPPVSDLLDRLLTLALERHQEKQRLRTSHGRESSGIQQCNDRNAALACRLCILHFAAFCILHCSCARKVV